MLKLHRPLAHAWWDKDQALADRTGALRRPASCAFLFENSRGHGLALPDAMGDRIDAGAVSSTALVAALPEVAELHIGHAPIGHSILLACAAIADFKAEAIKALVPVPQRAERLVR